MRLARRNSTREAAFRQQHVALRRSQAVLFAVWLSLTVATCMAAESPAPEAAIEQGREALLENSYPWYDAETGVLKPPAPSRDPMFDLAWLAAVFRFLGWSALVLLLVAIAVMLVTAFLRREVRRAAVGATDKSKTMVLSSERIEALPVDAQTAITDLLAAARQSYQRGDLARAIVLLFSHQLVELDRHQLLRLTKGKTNRQYLREVRRQGSAAGALVPLVERTMLLFEQAFFGNYPPSPEQFQSCWSRVEEFQSLLQQSTEASG